MIREKDVRRGTRFPECGVGGEKDCAARARPLLKGEVPAKQVEGFKNADLGRFNVWRPMAVDRTRGS